MPKDVEAIYSKIMGCSPVLFDASRTGWVARLRFLWGAGPRGGVTDLPLPRPPLDWEFQDRITVSKVRVKELAYVGDKSLPEQVHFEEGYAPTFKAKDIVAAQGQGAMYTFARQFEHPPDRLSQASEEAGERFFEDGCAFSPPAYEEHNLLWKGDSWRMPNPRERARIHMLPEALVEAYPRKLGETTLQRHANQNSAMGNGFHIPSVCAFFVMLFQTMQAEHIYAPMQCRQETWLSNRVEGTAFQPGIARDFPGVARDTELLLDMQMQFQSLPIKPKVWQLTASRLARCALWDLQLFAVHAHLHGFSDIAFGPEWQGPRDRAHLAASNGMQRAVGDSRLGLDHMFQPGLGKEGHMRLALCAESPFAISFVERDLAFAAEGMVIFGPFLAQFRAKQQRIWRDVQRALEPLEATVALLRVDTAQRVASSKKPGMMAFAAALLKWPDRTQAMAYLEGFQIVGEIAPSHLFRPLPTAVAHDKCLREDFVGPAADQAMSALVTRGEPRDAQRILELTIEEQQRGFAGPFLTKAELDKQFGRGNWRAMERFLHIQSCGKERIIDNAKKSGHNLFTELLETIFTTSPERVASAVRLIMDIVVKYEHLDVSDVEAALQWIQDYLDWLVFTFSTDDLPDAYRGCPVAPCDQAVSIVAVWTPEGWRFLKLYALAYGLASAVVHFNRLPCLVVALARRVFLTMAAFFFDDVGTLDFQGQAGQESVHEILSALGAPPKPSKSFPPSGCRHYLGTSVNVAPASVEGVVIIENKSSTKQAIAEGLAVVRQMGHCPSGNASKLRGQFGWLSSNAAGRCGRLGARWLADHQYHEMPQFEATDYEHLDFLAHLAFSVPPRVLPVLSKPAAPLVVYSDASAEPGELPVVGWVILSTARPDSHRTHCTVARGNPCVLENTHATDLSCRGCLLSVSPF
jgi:hypothetical protein